MTDCHSNSKAVSIVVVVASMTFAVLHNCVELNLNGVNAIHHFIAERTSQLLTGFGVECCDNTLGDGFVPECMFGLKWVCNLHIGKFICVKAWAIS